MIYRDDYFVRAGTERTLFHVATLSIIIGSTQTCIAEDGVTFRFRRDPQARTTRATGLHLPAEDPLGRPVMARTGSGWSLWVSVC